jgi:tetratricopeptide (TPR) repeat protein
VRVLLVTPDPTDYEPLAGLEELQTMKEAIAFHSASVEILQLFPPTWRHLRQTLLGTDRFDVIHFIGHGNPFEILLEAEDGCGVCLAASELVEELVRHNIKLAILNVCESEMPAKALVESGLPAALGTSSSILDSQSLTLTGELYGTLASGHTLGEAIHQIRTGLANDPDPSAAQIPVLFGDDTLHFAYSAQKDFPGIHTYGLPRLLDGVPPRQRFFGYRQELTNGLRHLANPHIDAIEVVGLHGSGKTTFGSNLVHRGAWHFFGVIWLSLKNQATSIEALIVERVGSVLGVENIEDTIRQFEKLPLLLVFDDAEYLTSDLQQELVSILARIPYQSGNKIIFIAGSPLPFLSDHNRAAHIPLTALDQKSSLLYLLDCARRRHPGTFNELPIKVCQAFADMFSAQPTLMEWVVDYIGKVGSEQAMTMFEKLPAHLVDRLEALLQPILVELTNEELQVLESAAVFAGPIQSGWLMGVAQLPSAQEELLSLIDRRLLSRVMPDRYIVPPLLQGYLTAKSSDEKAFLRHAQFFAGEIAQWGIAAVEDYGFSHRNEFVDTFPEALLAIQRCNFIGDVQAWTAIRDLAAGLRDYLHFQRQDWRAIIFFEQAAAQACKMLNDESGLGASLASLGAAQVTIGLTHQGSENIEEAIRYLTSSKDNRALSIAYGALGYVQRRHQNTEEAIRAYETALNLSEQVGDFALSARHLSNLGTTYKRNGNLDQAGDFYQRALTAARQTDNQYLIASQLDMIGHIARLQGDSMQSIQSHKQAYWIRKQLNDTTGLRMTLTMLASSYKNAGRPADIIDDVEAVFDNLDDQVNLLQRWLLTLQVARLRRDMGHLNLAIDLYEEALALAQEQNYFVGMSMCERGLGYCYKAQGELKRAQVHFQRALDLPSNESYQKELMNILEELQSLLS